MYYLCEEKYCFKIHKHQSKINTKHQYMNNLYALCITTTQYINVMYAIAHYEKVLIGGIFFYDSHSTNEQTLHR